MVMENDFSFSGLDKAGHTSNMFSSAVTPVIVTDIPGLNTLGISMARIDYAAFGLNPPHTHHRGTKILYVAEGTLQVGFVTLTHNNTFISKVLQKGDVFVFPIGLIHYEWNVGNTNAAAIVALSSQNPGVISIAKAVFGSEPNISSDVLAKSFQIPTLVVDQMKSKF